MNHQKTLNQTLDDLGYTTEKAKEYEKKQHVMKDGEILFTGDAGEVWYWLRSKKLISRN